MEFKINQISESSSFSPNLILYRINDEIYDEIHYEENMFYILHRCGKKKREKADTYDIYIEYKDFIIYPLKSYEIYEEYFEYEKYLRTHSEITSVSIVNGDVVEENLTYQLETELKEYYELYHGSLIDIDTKNYDSSKNSYVYKIKNNYPHELINGKIITDNISSPSVVINGLTTQNGIPSMDNVVSFSHVGEPENDHYRISVAQEIKLNNLNPYKNIWELSQYSTMKYNDLSIFEKLKPHATVYYNDEILMQDTALHEKIPAFSDLTSNYVVYGKAYIWCNKEMNIVIRHYNDSKNGLWINKQLIYYGSRLNENRPYSVTLSKGRNLIEFTAFRDNTSGGYFRQEYLDIDRSYKTIPISQYSNIDFLSYCNKKFDNTINKNNEDFYFESPIQLKSIGDVHDNLIFSDNSLYIEQNIFDYTLKTLPDFKKESDNIWSILSPVNIIEDDDNLQILSDSFVGVKYSDFENAVDGSISYHSGRIYISSSVSEDILRKKIFNGVSLLYISSLKRNTYHISQGIYNNNNYTNNEEINLCPNLNNALFYTAYKNMTVCSDEDGNIKIEKKDVTNNYDNAIYQDITLKSGHKYTISLEVKGTPNITINNGFTSVLRYTIVNTYSRIKNFLPYSLSFTADRNDYRIMIFDKTRTTSNITGVVIRNVKIVEDDYIPEYAVSNTDGNISNISLSYDTSYKYSSNYSLVEVEENKKYSISRPISGDSWRVCLYDKFHNIVGYSEYLSTSDTTVEYTIPKDVFYIKIVDSCNNNSGYSVKLLCDTDKLLKEISELELQLDESHSNILALPHILKPGDELVYDESFKEWTYYPLSYEEDFITYTTDEFSCINLNGNSHVRVQSPLSLDIVANKKETRYLQRPDITLLTDAHNSGEAGFGYVEWKEVVGADKYNIYVNNNLVESIESTLGKSFFKYDFQHELIGDLYITATNDYMSSDKSLSYNIMTVPNTPKIKSFNSIYENNRYYIDINFDVNSKIADYYNLSYSVDESVETFNKLDINGKEYLNCSFTVSDITDNLVVKIYSVNDTGLNDYMNIQEFIKNSGITKWTYKKAIKQILLAWNDEFENEDKYLLKYSIDGSDWQIAETDKSNNLGEQLLEYLSLPENSEMRVCIAPMINGYMQIFTKPITVSKALDKTLIPPSNFKGTKLSTGLIQFTWDDDYNVDNTSFELYYKYSDGTSQTVKINNESSGDKYTYVYNVDTYGFVNAKVRMIWELGESDYSDEIVVYNIPVVEKAPNMHHQQRENTTLKISWESYDFVKSYTLLLTVDGKQELIECFEPSYSYIIPKSKSTTNISASVRAVFIDGSYTNVSTPITFIICTSTSDLHQTIYAHTEEENDLYTTILGKGLNTPYNIYTLSKNSFFKYYNYFEKTYQPYLEQNYDLIENYWGHNIGGYGLLETNVSNKILKNILLYNTIYSNVNKKYDLHSSIYTQVYWDYKLYSEFTKVVIACLGDSITAGHPNFWAETGTGIINSQYEYWLSRRLKDEYNVVNCGYGQEKTQDMVDRFERDIVPLNANYCIFLGGTNDWYQDASTKDLATGYTVMDRAIANVKTIIQKCWDNGIYPIIGTLTPRRDITNDGKKLFDYFNEWVKTYTTEQSILGKDCAYVDFFNAGKDFDPPEPLGDPDDEYKLNPLYDGDNVYDENGNMIRSGLGVHPNPEGYRVMGYSIPLALFKTSNSGMRLYSDADCMNEEFYNTEEASHPYYQININNVRRGTEKKVIKYIKNVGVSTTLYYIYITSDHNMKYYFIDSQGNKKEHLTGVCNPGLSKQLTLIIESEFDDFVSSFELHILTRDISS